LCGVKRKENGCADVKNICEPTDFGDQFDQTVNSSFSDCLRWSQSEFNCK
jgi:hypothetical protein